MSALACEEVWDGVDFTPCFRDRYLTNAPLALAAISAIIIGASTIRRRYKNDRRTTVAELIPPQSNNFSRLEASILLGSLAGTIVAEEEEDKTTSKSQAERTEAISAKLSSKESEKVIHDFRSDLPPAARRWANVHYWLGLVGSITWTIVEALGVYFGNDWTHLVFPAFVTIIAGFRGPVIPLITLHLPPSILLLRSAWLHSSPWQTLIPTAVELVLWAALISVPYYDELDRLLAGAVCHGGIGYSECPAHLEDPTSAFSRATYWFIVPFLWKHYWSPVTQEQIPALREDDGAAAITGGFRAFRAARDRKHEKKHGKPRVRDLGADIVLFFLPELAKQCMWTIIFTILQYLPPVGLRLLLQYIENRSTSGQPWHVAIVYIAMMAMGQSVGVMVIGQALMLGRRVCVRIRAVIIAEVFAKALRREDRSGAVKKQRKEGEEVSEDEDAPESSSDGKVANIVSVDAFTISEIGAYIFYLVSCPLGIVINLVLLHHTLGAAAWAGVAVLLFLVPVQTVIGKLFTLFQRRLMAATDRRLEDVTEVISFIKLIKYNSWQDKFFDRMSASRKHELSVLAQRFGLIVFSNVVIWGTPVLVTGSAFGVHVLVLKQPLTADRAFASLVLFNMLRDPLALAQDTITRLLQAYTSCSRIQDFLNEPDTLKYAQLSTPGPSDPAVGFRDALFAYPGTDAESAAENQRFRLGELDLSFPPGKLSVVTGPVGSGKTTLILSLLGETVLLKGKVFMPDDMANRDICPVDPVTGLTDTAAYCAQNPWLIGASIRDNIVFGSTWDAARYDAVVAACALRRDFEIFDLGDATSVGEKGTTTSGGQKARIALARALYSTAKTVILDDVLSAVDAQTARHIHKHVLMGPLMEGRTCILITHAVHLVVPSSAFVVMLDAGQVVASGTPASLSASGALDLEPRTPIDEEDYATSAKASTVVAELVEDIIEETLDGDEHEALIAKKVHDAHEAVPSDYDKQLVQKESTGQGAVGAETYGLYFRSMGSAPFWVLIVCAFIGTQGLQVLTTAWVKEWSEHARQAFTGEGHSTMFYLLVYMAISGLYLIGIAVRMIFTFYGSLSASRKLYNRMLKRILGAKMRFFDSTPSGRIMNRLSKDMSSIDQEAAEIIAYFVNCVLSCMAVLAVVAYSTPLFLFSLVFIVALYWAVGTLYVTTNREIKRYDSVSRSPLFVSFSEALVGMATIRSYGDSARFIRKLLNEIDTNTRCFWYLWQANRVLNNLSNFVGTLVTVSASVLALSVPGMSAGAAGLSITYALSFTEYVLWVVRLYAAAEMSMNSVERVGEYLDLEVEEEDKAKGIEPPAYWPSSDGSVVVENLTAKYAPQLDPVLKDVSFTIGPREKIGICGRTGSGKSTLALTFFRFLYQEGGRILVDGQDISKLSLSTLRSRLTILPQEAQLFSGTIRDNMDPFTQHEDYEIWEALRQCGLAGRTPGTSADVSRAVSRVNSTTELAEGDERGTIRSLDENVAVGGKNFSQGQRQLLALARGLLKLRSSSFLIMDESTANLDHATDATIQNVLRTGLADTQMLVIAHRLMTVCGLDKILVLDHGRVIEFGTPWELLQDEQGSFRDLCRQSGEEAQLLELAREVHDRKQAASQSST